MDYNDINNKFKKYKLKESKESMRQICLPKKFKLQPSQKFLRDYFKNNKSHKGILVYHKIGAGKTCTAIVMAEEYKKKLKIMVVLPAALIGNFRNELRSLCAGEEYISNSDRKKLSKLDPNDMMYKKIIEKSDKIINRYYTIYSYHKFIMLTKKDKISLKDHLLIIDEVQNMISMTGTFYKNLKREIDRVKKKDKFRIILLSATPMFDKPDEIALTFNLLKPKKQLPIGNEFNNKFLKKKIKNDMIEYKPKRLKTFKNKIKYMVSYYRGASPQAFPEEIFKVVRCRMGDFQYKSYLSAMADGKLTPRRAFKDVDILNLPNNFFIGTRMISNIAFPNKCYASKGYCSLTKKYMKDIKKYSIKFYKIYNKIKKSTGPVFVYSNFKEYGGLKSLILFLESRGYKNYKNNGIGKKRYAVWSGDSNLNYRETIKTIYNNSKNKNGEMIKILLGSPSIKEGVTLLRVEQVHIMEPYWNLSRILQIIGRAIRYCSHKDMPRDRRFVNVYLYLAIYKDIDTIDKYIWLLAKRKSKLIGRFETALKEMAIDCNLFYKRNIYKGEKEYNCFNQN
jgi:superfamily II DNA or RNA helicase